MRLDMTSMTQAVQPEARLMIVLSYMSGDGPSFLYRIRTLARKVSGVDCMHFWQFLRTGDEVSQGGNVYERLTGSHTTV